MTGLRTPRPVRRALRTPLTLIDAMTHDALEVVVELDPATPAEALEAAVTATLRPPRTGLWLDGCALTGPIGTSGLRPGSVLGLGGPLSAPAPGPVVHVVAGVGAGAVHRLDGPVRLGRVLVSPGPAGVVATWDGGRQVLRPGEDLDLGDRRVRLGTAATPKAADASGVGLEIAVARPPRLRPHLAARTLQVPQPPGPRASRPLPVVPLLLPVLAGVVMAVLSSPLFLLFTLLSPLMALSTWWSDRGQGRRQHRAATEAYEGLVAELASEEAALRGAETRQRHSDCPDPATLAELVSGPRVWERRRSDDDCLVLRVGTGERSPRSYRLSEGVPPALAGVPVTLGLRDVGVVGVLSRATARWMVLQAAVLHGPRDLGVWLLIDPAREPSEPHWGWVRWLPHAVGAEGALVGNTVESLARRLAGLTALLTERTAAARDVRSQLQARQQPDVLVVLDGARALRTLPGVAALLRDGPAVGMHVLCVDDGELQLPEECQAVVLDGEVRRQGRPPEVFLPDLPTAEWAADVARSLAPLRDAGAEGDAEVPSAARLLEVLQLDPPTAEGVRARAGRTTAAVIGLDADGPVVLDLRRDGPHVLVAGTTGAGKSELLQSLVASLAVANTPDAMTFVLVDYKGGAAFKDCARLPHTVGLVTDLDGHLVERALVSLTAELKAREALLAGAGAKDIEELWAAGGALPRLVIVIDEFASLVEELPDFVRGLVGIAQRGRSLGVHLVLATQRPSGVVSPEIRANTNLRVALRVTDAAESLDVLDAPDAAGIPRSTPGRAFARTGASSLFPFQTARVGGRRPGAQDASLRVVEVPWSQVGLPLPSACAEELEEEATDLHALVTAICDAYAGATPPRRPWLAELPTTLPLGDLDAPRPLVLPYALEDLPGEQRRRTAALDLAAGGHLLVAGSARSGRTTLLRALATSLAAATSPDDAHLYVLDCGSGGLLPLAELPHTGAVVTRQQPHRADRLLARLTAEVARRQELFASRGWSDLAEQRAASESTAGSTPGSTSESPLPYLLLLVDRWEGFTGAFDEVDNGRLPETLLRLVRDGLSAGLRVVVTGDRTALIGKLSQAVEDVVVLRLAERSDYALAGLAPRQLPGVIGDGRGFRGGTGVELQVACPPPSLPVAARGRTSPMRVDPLPTHLTWDEAGALPSEGPGIAVGGDELTVLAPDLRFGFTIAGPAGSGRSTALCGLARNLLAAGTTVCALTPRPSPLRTLPGVRHADDAESLVVALNGASGPLAVLVDDAELLVDAPVAEVLAQVLREGRDAGHALVVAGGVAELAGTFRGFAADVRKSRSGLLLGLTNHLDGELLGVRLPRSAVAPGPTGRGLLVRSGAVTAVQVPLSRRTM